MNLFQREGMAAYFRSHGMKRSCLIKKILLKTSEGTFSFTSFIQLILKDASNVSFKYISHPQSFANIPIHKTELTENESALSLSEFIMKCKTKILFSSGFVLASLQCHMIFQKSFLHADLLLRTL